MRYLILTLLFLAGPAAAGWLNITETHELSLDATQLQKLEILSGHGYVIVAGESDRETISVTAEVRIPAMSESKAAVIKTKYLDLDLSADGNTATLVGMFDDYVTWRGDQGSVRLTVHVPHQLDVVIRDGTGFIEVADLEGDLSIEDGSGSIDLKRIGGNVSIEDGEGWIDVDRVNADVVIKDRSGGISVSRVAADVVIDDGSGRVDVRDVSGDLTLVDNASGRFTYAGVQGVIRDES